ncbi:MAG TPA: SDR family NAD(P)-dependent oxidoreductase [Steroidobacteraceae bacterium]|nr:SDR family NAD(P)-dependent oxidoreductase [Steroidobacteraceae bacterium]
MSYELSGKVILITGAAGGIGAACARALYEAGASLVLTDVAQESIDRLAAGLDAKRVLALTLDVTDAAATKRVVQQAVERFGRLDVALANAGIAWRGPPGTIYSCDEQEWEHIVAVDFLGVWRTIKASLPEILRNQGQVLVTASIYSFMNGMIASPYAASKAGIEALTRALRSELAGTGATASVIYPGWIATPIAKVAFGGDDQATRLIQTAFPAPLRQPLPPESVAVAVVNGLRTRKPRIIVPARWVPIFWLRGLFAMLTDRLIDRWSELHALVRKIEQRSIDGR